MPKKRIKKTPAVAARMRNSLPAERPSTWILLVCEFCSEPFPVEPYRAHAACPPRFCSRPCASYGQAAARHKSSPPLIAKTRRKPAPRKEQLPLINYRAPDGLTIANIYHRGEFIHYPQIEITKAEYSSINIAYKGTREVEGTHRVRTAIVKRSLVCIFLTNSKTHAKPTNSAQAKEAKPETAETAETGDPEEALRDIWTAVCRR